MRVHHLPLLLFLPAMCLLPLKAKGRYPRMTIELKGTTCRVGDEPLAVLRIWNDRSTSIFYDYRDSQIPSLLSWTDGGPGLGGVTAYSSSISCWDYPVGVKRATSSSEIPSGRAHVIRIRLPKLKKAGKHSFKVEARLIITTDLSTKDSDWELCTLTSEMSVQVSKGDSASPVVP